jgi:hypothetical protein
MFSTQYKVMPLEDGGVEVRVSRKIDEEWQQFGATYSADNVKDCARHILVDALSDGSGWIPWRIPFLYEDFYHEFIEPMSKEHGAFIHEGTVIAWIFWQGFKTRQLPQYPDVKEVLAAAKVAVRTGWWGMRD